MERRMHVPEKTKAAIFAEMAAGTQSTRAIAEKHGVHVSTIYQWKHALKKKNGHAVVRLSSGDHSDGITNEQSAASERSTERHVIFAFAHCQTWLEVYANTLSIPPAFLAERVGELLLHQARGKKLRTDHRMPGMW